MSGPNRKHRRTQEKLARTGPPPTPEQAQANEEQLRAQFKGVMFERAQGLRTTFIILVEETEALIEHLALLGRSHKDERRDLEATLPELRSRLAGARDFVIATGIDFVDGIPVNPADPPRIIITPPEKKIVTP